jgi:hypothetical protein
MFATQFHTSNAELKGGKPEHDVKIPPPAFSATLRRCAHLGWAWLGFRCSEAGAISRMPLASWVV